MVERRLRKISGRDGSQHAAVRGLAKNKNRSAKNPAYHFRQGWDFSNKDFENFMKAYLACGDANRSASAIGANMSRVNHYMRKFPDCMARFEEAKKSVLEGLASGSLSPAKGKGKRVVPLSEAEKKDFCDFYREYGSVAKAATAVGRPYALFLRERELDDEFDEEYRMAREFVVGRLHETLFERAMKGYRKPITYQGRITAWYREFVPSDLYALLNAFDPENFKRPGVVEHTGKDGGPIEHEHSISARQLLAERLAAQIERLGKAGISVEALGSAGGESPRRLALLGAPEAASPAPALEGMAHNVGPGLREELDGVELAQRGGSQHEEAPSDSPSGEDGGGREGHDD